MAELLIRFDGSDAALLERLTGPDRPSGPSFDRIVVNAHCAAKSPSFAATARRAGIPFLVDPETYYLQDAQHPADPWAQLPFAQAEPLMAGQLLNAPAVDALVERCVEFQLEQGATHLLAPYVHVEKGTDGWVEVQTLIYRRTRRYLDAQGIQLPVTAPLAISWRLSSRAAWPLAVNQLVAAVRDLAPAEVALAVSKLDQGKRPEDRVAGFYPLIDLLGGIVEIPVVAWNQGIFGEAAVAAGAAGYETGIGWRERGDLRSRMSIHRHARADEDGFSARPVYIPSLGRSIPKRSLRTLLSTGSIAPDLICMEPTCCPSGAASLLGDARAHAVGSRARSLRAIAEARHPSWAWGALSARAENGIRIAEKINVLADRHDAVNRVDIGALKALQVTATARHIASRRAA